MTEKNQQEKMAAERQVELFTHAFEKAKDIGGVWLDNKGRKAPGLYQKHLQVSPFNALAVARKALYTVGINAVKICRNENI